VSEVSGELLTDELQAPLAGEQLLTDQELQKLLTDEELQATEEQATPPEDWDETAVSWDGATATCR